MANIVRSKHLRVLLLGLTLGAGLASVTFAPQAIVAQADLGSISGTVTDGTGAVIAKAGITVTNVETGAVRASVSNSRGEFSITQLNPGTYKAKITATGFSDTEISAIAVTVGSQNSLNAKLAVSGGKTEVVVEGDSFSGVELQKAEVSAVIETDQFQNLPTPDRNPYALVALSGSLSSDPTGGNRGVGFNIAGSRSASVDILLDGVENTDLYGVGIGQNVPLDAVYEVRIVTSNSGVEYGRGSGAVNVATKSGTNKLFGSVYEYNRISTLGSDGYYNNALHAAVPTSPAKPRYVHNQFGYSVGGPVLKNKLFFFSSTEWQRIRSIANNVVSVPTSQLIGLSNANMQAYFAKYGNLATPINGATFTGQDLINQGLFTSDLKTLSKTNPAILTTPLFGQVAYQSPGDSGGGAPQNQWISFNRGDWTINDKTSMFARYIQQSTVITPGYVNSSPYAGYNTGETQFNHSLELSLSHAFTPTLASATQVLGSRLNNSQPLSTAPVGPTLYVNGSGTVAVGGASINFPGYSALSPGSALPFGGPQNFIEIGENLSWVKGKNQFSFGGEFLYVKDNRTFGAYEEAVDGLVQSGSSGALSNFINGGLGLLQVAVNPNGVYPCYRSAATGAYIVNTACEVQLPVSSPNFSRSNRYDDGNAYAADSYKLTPHLTLLGGLRWEVYGPQHSQKPGYDANFFFGTGSDFWSNLRNGQILTRANAPNGRLWNLNLTQFAPKVGFAWDPFGNGKTSIRGGFGLSYERNFNNVTFNVIQNPPNYGVVSFTTADNNKQLIPISTNNFSTFGTGTGLKALPNVTLRAVDPKIKPAYAEDWSLTAEHQLNNVTAASLSYVHTRGIHNYSIANINRSFSGIAYNGDADAGFGLSNRSNLQYSNINFRGADGDSYYNGLTAELRGSNLFKTGLTVRADYTWAHSIDNTSSTFTDGGSNDDNLGYLDPFNHRLDRGQSDFDQRQRIATALFWAVPVSGNFNPALKALAKGWTVGTTFFAVTGNPYTLFDCYFAVNSCPRASFVGGIIPGTNRNLKALPGIDSFSYKTVPSYYNNDTVDNNNVDTTHYNEQVNPIVDQYYGGDEAKPADYVAGSDTPICSGIHGAGCKWVTGMSGRNFFSGPGSWDQDLAILKEIKIHERYALQLKGEFINLYNHANTYLNLGGSNDVSSNTDVLAYKSGKRNTQLSIHFAF